MGMSANLVPLPIDAAGKIWLELVQQFMRCCLKTEFREPQTKDQKLPINLNVEIHPCSWLIWYPFQISYISLEPPMLYTKPPGFLFLNSGWFSKCCYHLQAWWPSWSMEYGYNWAWGFSCGHLKMWIQTTLKQRAKVIHQPWHWFSWF